MINKTKKSEFDHFSGLASEWRTKNGKFKILHDIQELRLEYIKTILKKNTLKNTKILDVGCGGGLISEGLSKLGADVTGIDFIEENIKKAKIQAKKNKLKINYLVKDLEKEKILSKFDAIIIFEVLEHLNDWGKFIIKLRSNLKKNGILIISTINKNLISKFLTIDIAENFLKWIPIGTHTYNKFIKPEELEFFLYKNKYTNISFKGLTYNPLTQKWKLSNNTRVNYFCSCFLN